MRNDVLMRALVGCSESIASQTKEECWSDVISDALQAFMAWFERQS